MKPFYAPLQGDNPHDPHPSVGENAMKMLPVQLEIKPEGDHWLARCAALDVMTQGTTADEAMYNLNDALFLFVESCLRRGVWEQILREAGLSPAELTAISDYTREVFPEALKTA